MFNMSKEARAKRMNVVVNPGQEISLRAYNLILTGTVLYGLAINALLCRESIVNYVFNRVNPIVFFIVYFVHSGEYFLPIGQTGRRSAFLAIT